MKITMKPLKGEQFELEAEPGETLDALKARVMAMKPDLPAIQKMVHGGKVLAGSSTLGEAGVKDCDLIVMMPEKPRAAPAPAPAAPTPVVPTQPATQPFGGGMPGAGGFPGAGAPFGGGMPFGMPPAPAPPAGAPPASSAGPLAALGMHPVFFQLRNAVQQQPQALHQVMCTIAKIQPDLIPLIAEHQQEFVDMLAAPPASLPGAQRGAGGAPGAAAGGDPVAQMLAAMAQAQAGAGAGAPPLPGAAPGAPPAAQPAAAQPQQQLSPEDHQAIAELQSLGFDRRRALEAYLACDKNKEVAANYLFENSGF